MCICYLMSKNIQLKTNKLKLYNDIVYNVAKIKIYFANFDLQKKSNKKSTTEAQLSKIT